MAEIRDINEPIKPNEEDDDIFFDILKAPFRGIEGAFQGVYNLADYLSFDVLPDYDERFLGESHTTAGSAVEGISQFMAGFVPIFGLAGKVGKATTLTQKALKGVAASAVTDFTVFNGQEQRLSNLIQDIPELQNPVTEFLAHDEDEGEIEGRIKNVLEGLGLEAVGLGFIRGLRAMKKAKRIRAEDPGADVYKTVADEMESSIVSELPDFRKDIARVTSDLEAHENRLNELLAKKKKGEAKPEDETRINLLKNRIKLGKEDLEELKTARTADVSKRVREAEEAELREKLDSVDDAVEDIEEAIPLIPRPFKTYEEEGMLDIIPKGADKLKSRILKKFPIKGASVEDAEEVEKFIDVMGRRFFGDVSLSITNKIDSAGLYEWGSNIVKIRQDVIEGGGLKRTAIHELWHSLSRYLPQADLDALTKQFNKARADYINSFGIDFEVGADPSTLLKRELPDELRKFLEGKRGGYNENNYRFKNIDEYFAEEMTDEFLRRSSAGDFERGGKITFKGIARDVAILLKDLFASIKAKLGIDQRRKIFNDFLADRKLVKKRTGIFEGPLRPDGGVDVSELPEFEVRPEHQEVAEAIVRGEQIDLPRFETDDGQFSFTASLRKAVENDPETMAKIEKDAKENVPVDFFDDLINDRYKAMDRTIENQKAVRREAYIYKKIGAGFVKKLHDAAIEFRASGGGDIATSKLKNIFQEIVTFSEYYWRLGRETSLALSLRREKPRRKKIGLSEAEMQGEGIRKNFINDSGNLDPEKLVVAIESLDPSDFESGIKAMFDLGRKVQGNKFLDIPTEYWINSILSGPKTHVVNAMGNTLTSVFSTLEEAVGGVLTGNLEVTKQAFASWSELKAYKDILKFTRRTWSGKENLLDPEAKSFNEGYKDAITPEAFGKKEGDKSYKTIKRIGEFLRLPTRLLMTGDELFKQINYRRAAHFKLAMDGVTKHGITDPKKLAEYIHQGVESVITSGGRHYSEEAFIKEGMEKAKQQGINDSVQQAEFVSKYVQDNWKGTKSKESALAQFALDEARYLTFTRDLKEGTLGFALQRATQEFTPLRFVLPFVRTPTNILKFAIERTPGVLFLRDERKQLLDDLFKPSDPIRRAKAAGKLATSTALAATLIDHIANNREFITGGGPKDEKEKKALEATGWRPYSFKIGDAYYSYQRLDPLGTIVGVGADLLDSFFRAPRDFDQSKFEQVFSAMTLTFTRNVTNKSYLAGVQMFSDALSDPERYGEKVLRNFGSAMLPYSGMLGSIETGFGDKEAKELRSVSDAILNKLPFAGGGLDKKRNILGEEIIIENKPFIGAVSPIAFSSVKNDLILNEMANLNHAFRQPRSTYGGLIDLLEFRSDDGQSAYDRSLEKLKQVKIGKRTLRQSLERLIKSKNYQRLPEKSEPGLPSPRIRQITNILTKYRDRALEETMQEYPELSDYYERYTRAKRQSKAGVDVSDVLSTLTGD